MRGTLEYAKETGKNPDWVAWSLHQKYDQVFGVLVFMNCYMGVSDEVYKSLKSKATNELFTLLDKAFSK